MGQSPTYRPEHHPHNDKDKERTKRKAFKRSPCGRPPKAPENAEGHFDRTGGGRHKRINARVKWAEVNQDTSDIRIRIRHYKLQMWYTPNGEDWFLHKRATVSAKDDDDPGGMDHYVFHGLDKARGYKYKVRAVAFDGCKSAWAEYVIGNPGTDEPPAPQDVKIKDHDKHNRISVRWSAQKAEDDEDLFDDRINHFVVQISKNSGFGTIYMEDNAHKGNHHSFRIDDEDEEDTFFARVRSVSADKDKSNWIPATTDGNSDPDATPDGVDVGQSQEKSKKPKAPTNLSVTYGNNDQNNHDGRWRAKVVWDEVTQTITDRDVEIQSYAVVLQKSDNGTTWTDDPRRIMVPAKDEDGGTTAHAIFHNIDQRRKYRARVRAVSDSGTKGEWTDWTGNGAGPGSASVPTPVSVTVRHKTRGKDKVVVDWDAPADASDADLADERIAYFQVAIKKNSAVAPTTLASAYKYDRKQQGTDKTFHVPRADEDDDFYGWVRSVDVDGNKSAWVAGTRSGNSSTATTAEKVNTDDGVKVGVVRKWAGTVGTIPQGYLHANGQAVSTSAYPELFDAIGYRFGGSGATFNVPDHRRRGSRGAGTGQTEGDSDGQNEADRNEDHGKHNKGKHKKHKAHRHKHHHRRRRRHDPHGEANATEHGHFIAGQNVDDTASAAVGTGSGSANAARQAHNHLVPAHSTNVGGAHTHPSTQTQGTQSKLKGQTYYLDGGGGNAGHEDHDGEQVEPATGVSSLYTDSLTGGSMSSTAASVADRSTSWNGGPTDTSGNTITIDDDDAPTSELGSGNAGHGDHALPDDDDGVRGHRRHPHIRFHFMVKAE